MVAFECVIYLGIINQFFTMPELPEVETIANNLAPLIQAKIITNVWTSDLKMRSQLSEIDKQFLPGKRVHNVTRVGKYLVIELLEKYLLIHFGMSGRLIVAQNALEMKQATYSLKHIHFCLDFGDFLILYQDPRRFGSVRIVSKAGPKTTGQLSTFLGIGFEPLSEKFGAKELFYMTRGISRHIKIFLMDGKKIAGVGNIYAAEALFRAGIRPTLPCFKLSIAKCSQLVACLKSVLLKAISKGGSSLRDFSGLSGERGSFVDEHLVYGKKENCVICKADLRRINIGQRTTTFCPRCQR